MRQIIERIPALRNASDSTSGVKVTFDKNSKYGDFIQLLNAVNALRVRRYAFETRVYPPIFYVLEDRKLGYHGFPLGPCVITTRLPEPSGFNLKTWSDEFWQFKWLKLLAQPEWRVSMRLFAAMALLSFWQIARNMLFQRE